MGNFIIIETFPKHHEPHISHNKDFYTKKERGIRLKLHGINDNGLECCWTWWTLSFISVVESTSCSAQQMCYISLKFWDEAQISVFDAL